MSEKTIFEFNFPKIDYWGLRTGAVIEEDGEAFVPIYGIQKAPQDISLDELEKMLDEHRDVINTVSKAIDLLRERKARNLSSENKDI